MTELRLVRVSDLYSVASWISSAADCRQWAGERVRFPVQLDQLPDEIEFENAESWGLFLREALIGFGQVVPKPLLRVHLARLIVAPNSRGRGVGRELTEHLLTIAYAKSPASVSLNVFPDNFAAVRLYRDLGFCPGERPPGELPSGSQYMVHQR